MKSGVGSQTKILRQCYEKIIFSLGLVAAGTASLQAAYAPDVNSMQTTKIWSVSAHLARILR